VVATQGGNREERSRVWRLEAPISIIRWLEFLHVPEIVLERHDRINVGPRFVSPRRCPRMNLLPAAIPQRDSRPAACGGVESSERPLSPGYASSRRSAIVASSARACSGETPLRKRPATCRNFALRFTSLCMVLRNPNGAQRSYRLTYQGREHGRSAVANRFIPS